MYHRVYGKLTIYKQLKKKQIISYINKKSQCYFIMYTQNLREEFKWSNLYGSFGGCSGVDVYGEGIVACGETGAIHVLHSGRINPIHSICWL